jgi:two-component system, LytTR family, response regulator
MIQAYIIDDEPEAIEYLSALVAKTAGLQLAGHHTNPVAACAGIRTLQPDIVFIDIDMREMSGLEAVQRIRKINTRAVFVFVTGYRQYALESYELGVVDYLLKPVPYLRFLEAIDKCNSALLGQQAVRSRQPVRDKLPDHLLFKAYNTGGVVKIKTADIIYAKSRRNYADIITTAQKYTVRITMKELVSQLSAPQFARVHRSYIAAVNKVQHIGAVTVTLSGSISLPLGNTYKGEVLKCVEMV